MMHQMTLVVYEAEVSYAVWRKRNLRTLTLKKYNKYHVETIF